MEQQNKATLQQSSGSTWPGEVDIGDIRFVDDRESSRLTLGIMLGVVFGLLLVVFTAYGMVTADNSILESVFEVVRTGITAGVGWAMGRRG